VADKPETLEETQARLARMQQTPAQPHGGAGMPDANPPAVSSPVPEVAGQPATPYGPSAAGGDPAHPGGATPWGTAQTRPDPYAGAAAPAWAAPTAAPTGAPKSRLAGVLIGIGVVVFLVIGGVVAYGAFSLSSPSDPFGDGEYSEEWVQFPGVAWSHPDEVLAQPSYEEVVAESDALVSEYREALTAEFGLTWTEQYESYSGLESNGYGGDSMLYYYDSGTWLGQVRMDDPAARERAFELFTQLALAHGGDGVLLRNEVYADDPEMSTSEFGAAEPENQALWSFFDSFPSLAGGYLSVDLMDRTIPVDASFDGDYMFSYEESYTESSDTFFISISCYSGPLLKEGDREAFEKALEPYNGDYEP
jgi:hypothetical protein